jgi:hypothetical protein
MNGRLAQLTRSLRRHKRLIWIAAIAILAFGWGDLQYRAFRRLRPPHAKQRYETVHDRAAKICTAIGTECQLDPHPIFIERRTRCFPGDTVPLRLWKFMCLVDGRVTWLMLNDDSAGLTYLIAERNHLEDHTNAVTGGLKTRAEAAEAGFQRLKQMKLLGHGSLIALRGIPHINPLGNVWEMTWSVKRDAKSEPYMIRMELDRAKGTPISLVDNSQLFKPDHS